MDLELSLITGLTRHLPPIRGSLRLAYALGRLYNRKPRAAVIAKVRGASMELMPAEYVDSSLLLCPNLYDRWEFGIVAKHARRGQIAFDLGSHIGTYALFLSHLVGPTGRVFAFEAWPPTFERLLRNLARNAIAANITAQNIALSDQAGKFPLYVNETGNAGGNTLLYPGKGRVGDVGVECKTLADVVDCSGVDRIDFMKIDVENMEYRVLSHFLNTAPATQHPRVILTEYHASQVPLAGGDLLKLLTQAGYRKVDKSPGKGVKNVLFIGS